MDDLSSSAQGSVRERAQRIAKLIRDRVGGEVKQAAIASAMGVSDSTVSRAVAQQPIDTLARVLAHAGLKVVPIELRCFHEQEINALLTLARGRLAQCKSADELSWE